METESLALIAIGLIAALILAIKGWKAATKELKELEKDNTHIPAERSDYN